MISRATAFILLLALTACGAGQQGRCEMQSYGRGGISVRAARTMDGELAREQAGRLVVIAYRGVLDGEFLDNASVTVRSKAGDSPEVRRLTNYAGRVRFDSLRSGTYDLVVRRIGSEAIHGDVSVRTGFEDSVFVALRASPLCATRS